VKALVCKAKNFTCLRCRCQSLTGIGGRSYAAGPNICLRLRRLLTVTNSVCSSPSSRRTPGSVFCTAKAFFVYPLQADAIVIASNIYLVCRYSALLTVMDSRSGPVHHRQLRSRLLQSGVYKAVLPFQPLRSESNSVRRIWRKSLVDGDIVAVV